MAFAFLIFLNVREYINRKRSEQDKIKIEEVIGAKNMQYGNLIVANRMLRNVRGDILEQAGNFFVGDISDFHIEDRKPILNEYLSLIIESKKLVCEEKNINFLFESESDYKELPLKKTDAVSLFMNLLDNAIEACEGTEHPRLVLTLHIDQSESGLERNAGASMEKVLEKDAGASVESNTEGNAISGTGRIFEIYLENSKRKEHKPLETQFATTKQEPDLHGRGIGIIKEIIYRYSGDIVWEDLGESFITKIRFYTDNKQMEQVTANRTNKGD